MIIILHKWSSGKPSTKIIQMKLIGWKKNAAREQASISYTCLGKTLKKYSMQELSITGSICKLFGPLVTLCQDFDETEGLPVRASPVSLRCVLEQKH